MKVRKFVSIFLICCTVFGIAASNGTGFRISAEVTLPAESDLRMREGTLAIDDPNWLPPEARLTEEEIAALDPPPVTDEELVAETASNSSSST